MNAEEMKNRTKAFALDSIRLVAKLPKGMVADTLGRQLLRAGTSVGANYRSACRSRSQADFIAKMGIVEEEADEAGYWMELLEQSGLLGHKDVAQMMDEASQIVAIAVSSIKTARSGRP